MPKHSREPWKAYAPAPGDDHWRILAIGANVAHVLPEDEVADNAERIVACVNACQGIPTEALEKARSAALINEPGNGLFVTIDCGPPRACDRDRHE